MSYGDGIGFKSEEMVQELLQAAGWHVVNTRKAADDGQAPLSHAEAEKHRLPDFLAHHPEKQSRYVEVKAKSEPIVYGVEDSERHGWDTPKHEDYQAFAKIVDAPFVVILHEKESGVILRQRLTRLNKVQEMTDPDRVRQFGADGGMVFFEREQFETVTKNVAQFAAGYGQSGLIQDEADLDPFGTEPDGQQRGLSRFTGDNDE